MESKKKKADTDGAVPAKRTTDGRPYDNPEKRINNVNKSIAQSRGKVKKVCGAATSKICRMCCAFCDKGECSRRCLNSPDKCGILNKE